MPSMRAASASKASRAIRNPLDIFLPTAGSTCLNPMQVSPSLKPHPFLCPPHTKNSWGHSLCTFAQSDFKFTLTVSKKSLHLPTM